MLAFVDLQDNVRHNKYEVQKFQREAYLLRSLLHPGVLRVFGFCKVPPVACFPAMRIKSCKHDCIADIFGLGQVDHLLVTEVVTGGSLHGIIHGSSSSNVHKPAKKTLSHREVGAIGWASLSVYV